MTSSSRVLRRTIYDNDRGSVLQSATGAVVLSSTDATIAADFFRLDPVSRVQLLHMPVTGQIS